MQIRYYIQGDIENVIAQLSEGIIPRSSELVMFSSLIYEVMNVMYNYDTNTVLIPLRMLE